MNEISLMLKTPRGSILFVGCSHPGIEKILESATQIDPRIHSIFGGFHLVDIPDDQVTAMVMRMKEKWGLNVWQRDTARASSLSLRWCASTAISLITRASGQSFSCLHEFGQPQVRATAMNAGFADVRFWPTGELGRCPLLRRCWGDKRTSNARHPARRL